MDYDIPMQLTQKTPYNQRAATTVYTTQEFLSAILPIAPYYCVSESGKYWKDTPVQSIQEIINLANIASQSGANAYFALSGYETPSIISDGKTKFRIKQNAIAQKCFWLDVDCEKQGSSYATKTDALYALKKFCKNTSLPIPIIVSSGQGFHLYWPLSDQIKTEHWVKGATLIDALCRHHGFIADPARTKDAASVLRVPGTNNYGKDGIIRPVEILAGAALNNTIEFFKLLIAARPEGFSFTSNTRTSATSAPKLFNTSDIPRGIADNFPTLDTLVNAEPCIANCKQLKEMGFSSYPNWFNAMNVLRFCENGREVARELSMQDTGRFKDDIFNDRFNQAEQMAGGPTLCTTFESKDPERCKGCAWKENISTPKELAYKAVSASNEPEPSFFGFPILFSDMETSSIDTAILPPLLRNFVEAVSESIQVPTELVLINALTAMAIAVQGRAQVFIHNDYTEPLNLYALAALPPGERKSAIVEICKKPLVDWEREAAFKEKDRIQTLVSDRKSLEKIIESKRNLLGRTKNTVENTDILMNEIRKLENELPEIPVTPRLFVDDITPEALADRLAQHDERIGFMVAEGGIFETLAGRYSQGVPNIDLFLKAWNGEPVTVDRKKGSPVQLYNPLLTVGISPQPDVIANLADKPGFKGRGLLARFMYILPKSMVGYRQVKTKPISEDIKIQYADKLKSVLSLAMPFKFDNDKGMPYPLRLTPEAECLRLEFARYIEENLREGGELETLKEWASKLSGNTLRITGLLHFYTHDNAIATLISAETIKTAIVISYILIEHAKAAFALMGANLNIECAKKILAWIKRSRDTCVPKFTGRDCLNALKSRYSRMAQINEGLAILEERHFIATTIKTSTGKAGRPASQTYVVNPAIWKENNE